ncbi:30S ribosomal protein S16 [Megasphaera sp. ASD88]|uniref:30S ribosomal protein S16 n=1 Tax=Megasphaera sp. ASD88 TaxID=2027407 RepID=UPI000BAB688D|nr:30S ribosomal protein S16 [Megasphaera sp. ASD88]PAV39179.1 30S ribosomal protein S16 [Megasphaera sp. ASD88]
MIKIRLARLGAKKKPVYRVVVADSRDARNNGRPVATIGTYDPAKDVDSRLVVNAEEAVAWLGKGAQPTDTIRSLFKKAGIMAQFEASKKK